jgi:hypothetical protein
MRGAVRHVEWVGDDDPQRLEAATVTLAEDRLDALGTSRTTDYVTAWSLETGPGWITRRLDVTVAGRFFSRRLRLTRDDRGAWSAETEAEGDGSYQGERMPPPGIADAAALAGALDCDLALCPVTNTMPIRRLGLLGTAVPETALTMAWVALPSLTVQPDGQLYSSESGFDEASGHALVRYRSADGAFAAGLTVDQDGLVIDYPRLARRIRTRSSRPSHSEHPQARGE